MACMENTAVLGCHNGAPVAVHYVYDNSGQPAVFITDLVGEPVTGANLSNTTLGECAAPARTVNVLRHEGPAAQGFAFPIDTLYSITVTFFAAGQIQGANVPAGFTWSASGVEGGLIANAINGQGTNYIVTTVTA